MGDRQPPTSARGDRQPPTSARGDRQPPVSARGDRQPPASARGASARLSAAPARRVVSSTAVTNGKTARPLIKTAATGGKNLLPSKVKPLSTATEGPIRPRLIPGASSKKCEITRQKNDLYDLYLLNFVQTGLLRDMKKLQEQDHLEAGMTKIIDMIGSTRGMVKSFVNKMVLKLWDDLKQLDIIAAAFENLVDFTGEETLAEIQTLLMRKFEKITVTGATMKEPIFHGVEMEQLLDRVRAHLTGKIEEEKVIGFTKIFSETLNKLTATTESTENTIERLQQENKIVLEHCSLTICDKRLKAHEAKNENEKVEQEENEEKKEEEGALADED